MKSVDKSKQYFSNLTINKLLISQNSNLNLLQLNSRKNVSKINEVEENNNAIEISNNNILYPINIKSNESYKKCSVNNNIRKNKIDSKSPQIKKYEKLELFPYRYYFFISFIKNIDIRKLTLLFSKKFTKVHLFLSRMFDISSYLFLLREFQMLKNTVLKGEEINIIEKDSKINVNGISFMKNMNECIDKGQFKIFSENIRKKRKNE